jgi:hypothetical protein
MHPILGVNRSICFTKILKKRRKYFMDENMGNVRYIHTYSAPTYISKAPKTNSGNYFEKAKSSQKYQQCD